MIRICLLEKCNAIGVPPENFLQEFWDALNGVRRYGKLNYRESYRPIGSLEEIVNEILSLEPGDPLNRFFSEVRIILRDEPGTCLAQKIVLCSAETMRKVSKKTELMDLLKMTTPRASTERTGQKSKCIKTLSDVVFRVFDYGNRRLNNQIFRNFKRLPWSVCIYCGRNYISQFPVTPEKGGQTKRAYQLDHFLGKKNHPLFALSLFNLVPSCAFCNGPALKGSKSIGYTSPWEKNYSFNHLYRFGLQTSSQFRKGLAQQLEDLESGESNTLVGGNDIAIGLETQREWIDNPPEGMSERQLKEQQKDFETMIGVLKLRQRYQLHWEEVKRIVEKKVLYPDSMITELARIAKMEENVIKQHLFEPKSHADTSDRTPLSKLSHDVHRALGIMPIKDGYSGLG